MDPARQAPSASRQQQQMNNSTRSNTSEVISDTQLIVNYLPYNLSEQEFYEIFAQFGPLDQVHIIRDHVTMKPRGYGFVYYKQSKDASTALERLQGFQLYSRRINIAFAKQRSGASGFSSPSQGASYHSETGGAVGVTSAAAMDV